MVGRCQDDARLGESVYSYSVHLCAIISDRLDLCIDRQGRSGRSCRLLETRVGDENRHGTSKCGAQLDWGGTVLMLR